MTQQTREPVEADLERLALLQKPVTEYREFALSASQWNKFKLYAKHQFHSFYFVSPPPWRIQLRKLNNSQRAIPEFCSTGAIRSGTTVLASYIFQHPCVVLPIAKELSSLQLKSDFIMAQFPTRQQLQKTRDRYGVAMTGYASPYSPSATVTMFQKRINPAIKTVVIMRNPVERTISHWCWDLMRMKNTRKDALWRFMPDFEQSMKIEMREVPMGGTGFQTFSGTGSTSYIRHSIYAPFLELMQTEMGADNVHVVIAEEFFKSTHTEAQKVYDFLGLPPYSPVDIKETNAYPRIEVSPAFRQELREFFQPYNQQLAQLIGRELPW